MGEKVREAPIDVTDFRKRYTVSRYFVAESVATQPVLPKGIQNTLVKELEDADRVRN